MAKMRIKDPHGKDMDYKVEKLKVLKPEPKDKPADKKKAKKK
jgi:hypothetical protein